MKVFTYKRLDRMLKRLGFLPADEKDNGRTYLRACGFYLKFPNVPDDDPVPAHHIIHLRFVLDQFSIPEPDELSVAFGRATRPRNP